MKKQLHTIFSLTTMTRNFLLVIMLLLSTHTFAFSWDDLWLGKDQQAEKAMNAGEIKKAAKLFHNQDWQGVANYRSGDYKAALNNFKQNSSATGYYNQGNALAQMGDYQKAIEAYNQALRQNPTMADAKFNKALLEKLQKQQAKNVQKSNPQNDKPTDQDQKNNNQSSQSHSNQNQSKQNNQQENNQNQNDQNQSTPNQAQSNQAQPQQNQSKQQNPDPSQKKEKNNNQTQKQTAQNNLKQKGQATKAINEQQQATEQWLRGIPDDSGGLLRQKFLRDHQTYQAQKQQGKSSW